MAESQRAERGHTPFYCLSYCLLNCLWLLSCLWWQCSFDDTTVQCSKDPLALCQGGFFPLPTMLCIMCSFVSSETISYSSSETISSLLFPIQTRTSAEKEKSGCCLAEEHPLSTTLQKHTTSFYLHKMISFIFMIKVRCWINV